MGIFKDLLSSKKFLSAVAGVIVIIGGKFGLELNSEELILAVSPLLAYILGQGIADNGKEKAKVESIEKTRVANLIIGATEDNKE